MSFSDTDQQDAHDAATATTTLPAADDEDQASSDEKVKIKEILHGTKVGKKSLWATTIETLGMSDGKTSKDDVSVSSIEDGVHMMKGLVQAKLVDDRGQADVEKWKFSLTPFYDFDATLDDLLEAFVQWSCKDDDETISSKVYNISKAFRRLESYATWMEDNRAVLSQQLTDKDKRHVHEMIGMKLTQTCQGDGDDDKKQILVWWIDLHQIKGKEVKAFNHDLTMIYFVWTCHMVLFQKSDSVVLVENLAKMGVVQLFTMFPADVAAKLDRLTIGVLPLKMTSIYLLHNPRWMSVLLTMMRPFMSKKMRQRMVVVKNKKEQKTLTDAVGLESIPKGFDDIEGLVEEDMFAKKIFNL